VLSTHLAITSVARRRAAEAAITPGSSLAALLVPAAPTANRAACARVVGTQARTGGAEDLIGLRFASREATVDGLLGVA
jgi:hypothetical protein